MPHRPGRTQWTKPRNHLKKKPTETDPIFSPIPEFGMRKYFSLHAEDKHRDTIKKASKWEVCNYKQGLRTIWTSLPEPQYTLLVDTYQTSLEDYFEAIAPQIQWSQKTRSNCRSKLWLLSILLCSWNGDLSRCRIPLRLLMHHAFSTAVRVVWTWLA